MDSAVIHAGSTGDTSIGPSGASIDHRRLLRPANHHQLRTTRPPLPSIRRTAGSCLSTNFTVCVDYHRPCSLLPSCAAQRDICSVWFTTSGLLRRVWAALETQPPVNSIVPYTLLRPHGAGYSKLFRIMARNGRKLCSSLGFSARIEVCWHSVLIDTASPESLAPYTQCRLPLRSRNTCGLVCKLAVTPRTWDGPRVIELPTLSSAIGHKGA